MSGDVQPRKRKDKKRKKDELGVEEPRGTAALLGEGDVYMHSQHEHGTGGHWCAKVIFFSLLAVLITLIGLIILENRGLTDLEANSVESRYSGVLEGWLEDAPDDDHHDEHTLELKHHEADVDHGEGDEHDDGDDHDEGIDSMSHEDDETDPEDGDPDDEDQEIDDQSNEYENSNEQDNDDNIESNENYDDGQKIDNDSEEDHSIQDDDDKEEEQNFRRFYKREVKDEEDRSANEDSQETENKNEQQDDENFESSEDNDEITTNDDDISDENDNKVISNENNYFEDDQQNSDEIGENFSEEDGNEDDEQHEEVEENVEIEVEKLENEVFDEDVSTEAAFTVTGDDSDVDSEEYDKDADSGDDDEEFLEPEDDELPVVERITAPAGKPLIEVEETSSEKPSDTLADEEEYEKQQEELRKEKEQASHLWLKLAVGGALLVATHAVVRRATAPGDSTSREEHAAREETPTLVDRRMTLITPETSAPAKLVPQEIPIRAVQEPSKKTPLIIKTSPSPKQESEDEEEEEPPIISKDVKSVEAVEEADDKELYSDEDEEEEIVEAKKEIPIQTQVPQPKDVTPEPEDNDDVSDDVEIIDEEQLDEEIVEEEDEDVEEEISDVDDAELLTRLEAKYGRLPEPERPGPKHKDGGNSIEDEWPGEPSDPYWRDQLDSAEDELRQDWLD